MWATSVPILVFLGLSVLDLGLMYAIDKRQTDKKTDVRQHHRLMPPPIRGGGIINQAILTFNGKYFVGLRSIANILVCSLPLLVRAAFVVRSHCDNPTCETVKTILFVFVEEGRSAGGWTAETRNIVNRWKCAMRTNQHRTIHSDTTYSIRSA